VYEYMRRGQSNENLTQLTGRVEWWQAGFEAIREKPLSGYGANFGGRYILESTLGETVSDLHSSFVQVLLDTGVIGLALFVAGLVATWFMMLRVRPYAANDPIASLLWLESLGVLSVLSVRSFFAIVLIWSWYVLNFGVILVFLSVVRRRGDSALHTGAAIAQPLPAARGRRPSIRR
jgi:O-antigen ligase